MWITDQKQITSLEPKYYSGKYWQIPNDKLEICKKSLHLYKIIDNGNSFDIIEDEEKIAKMKDRAIINKTKRKKEKELFLNQKSLKDTDYKIIKLMEQFLLNNQHLLNNPEYDINELHQLRQNNRNNINKLNKE